MSSIIDRLAKTSALAKRAAGGMDRFNLSDMPDKATDDVQADDSPAEAKNKLLEARSGEQEYSAPDTPALQDPPKQERKPVGPPPAEQMQPELPPPAPATVPPPPMPAPMAPPPPAPMPPGGAAPPPPPAPAPAPAPAPMPPGAPPMPAPPMPMPPKTASVVDRLAWEAACRLVKRSFVPAGPGQAPPAAPATPAPAAPAPAQPGQQGLALAQPAQQPPAAQAIANAPAQPGAQPPAPPVTTSSMPIQPVPERAPQLQQAQPKQAAARWRNPTAMAAISQRQPSILQGVLPDVEVQKRVMGRMLRQDMVSPFVGGVHTSPGQVSAIDNVLKGNPAYLTRFGLTAAEAPAFNPIFRRELQNRMQPTRVRRALRAEPATHILRDASKEIQSIRQSGQTPDRDLLHARTGLVDELRQVRRGLLGAQAPKTASAGGTVKRAFGYGFQPHPALGQTPYGFNPYGFPQGAYNNAFALNPTYGLRPGVGGFGARPFAAPGFPAAGGMGMGGMGMGMGGLGAFPGLGPPRMDEDTLKQQYDRQREMILNMAGQLDPNTGRPYSQQEIDRMMNSLNSNTTRALETMRQTQRTYGSGTSSPGSPQFGPSSGGIGAPHFGGHFAGLGGYGPQPWALPPTSGGGYGDSHNLDSLRQRLDDLRGRSLQTRMEAESGGVTQQALEEQAEKVRQLARQTSVGSSDGTDAGYVDPTTGQPIQFGRNSLFFGMSGRHWGLDSWRNFKTEYDRLARMKRQFGARQRIQGQHAGTTDAQANRLQQTYDEEERAAREDRAMQRQLRNAYMARALGVQPPGQQAAQQPAQPRPPAFPSPPPSAPPPAAQAPAPAPTPAPAAPAPTPQAPPQVAQTPPVNPGLGGQLGQAPKTASHVTPMTMDQLCLSSARGLAKRANLAQAARTLAVLTGGGALAGGGIAAMTAPPDYAPEAFARGARSGAIAGAGMGLGGAVGAGVGKLTGKTMAPTMMPKYRDWLPKAYASGGKLVGGTLGGGAALAGDHAVSRTSPWESGQLPVLDRLDAAIRRRSSAPFDPRTGGRTPTAPSPFDKLSSARAALDSMGLLKQSILGPTIGAIGGAATYQGHPLQGAARGALLGLGTEFGAGLGATGGGLLGAGLGGLHSPEGAAIGGLAGLAGGAALGGVGGYKLTKGVIGKPAKGRVKDKDKDKERPRKIRK